MSIEWSNVDYVGFVFAILVAAGGIMGYVKAQSVASAIAGLVFGGLLAAGAFLNSSQEPKPLLQLVTSLVLGGYMSYKFFTNGYKIMPSGLIAVLSIAVIIRGIIVYRNNLPFVQKTNWIN